MARTLWRVEFGQHMGDDVEEVPNTYLRWLLEQEWFERNYRIGHRAVKREMHYRDSNNIVVRDD